MMGVTVAQKRALFPVAFLQVKATLAALKLTNHEGGTQVLSPRALILHFWETLLARADCPVTQRRTKNEPRLAVPSCQRYGVIHKHST